MPFASCFVRGCGWFYSCSALCTLLLSSGPRCTASWPVRTRRTVTWRVCAATADSPQLQLIFKVVHIPFVLQRLILFQHIIVISGTFVEILLAFFMRLSLNSRCNSVNPQWIELFFFSVFRQFSQYSLYISLQQSTARAVHMQFDLCLRHDSSTLAQGKRRLFLSRVIISCLTSPPELLVFIACRTNHPFTFDPGQPGRVPNH